MASPKVNACFALWILLDPSAHITSTRSSSLREQFLGVSASKPRHLHSPIRAAAEDRLEPGMGLAPANDSFRRTGSAGRGRGSSGGRSPGSAMAGPQDRKGVAKPPKGTPDVLAGEGLAVAASRPKDQQDPSEAQQTAPDPAAEPSISSAAAPQMDESSAPGGTGDGVVDKGEWHTGPLEADSGPPLGFQQGSGALAGELEARPPEGLDPGGVAAKGTAVGRGAPAERVKGSLGGGGDVTDGMVSGPSDRDVASEDSFVPRSLPEKASERGRGRGRGRGGRLRPPAERYPSILKAELVMKCSLVIRLIVCKLEQILYRVGLGQSTSLS